MKKRALFKKIICVILTGSMCFSNFVLPSVTEKNDLEAMADVTGDSAGNVSASLSLSVDGNIAYVNVDEYNNQPMEWNLIAHTEVTYDSSKGIVDARITDEFALAGVDQKMMGGLLFNDSIAGEIILEAAVSGGDDNPYISYSGPVFMLIFDESQLPVDVSMNGQTVTVSGDGSILDGELEEMEPASGEYMQEELSLSVEGNRVYVNARDTLSSINNTSISYDASKGLANVTETKAFALSNVRQKGTNPWLGINDSTAGQVEFAGAFINKLGGPIRYTGPIMEITFDESQLPVDVTMNGQTVTVGGTMEHVEDGDYIIDDKGAALKQYTGDEETVRVPSSIGDKMVYAVWASAFAQSLVKNVFLPDTIKSIGSMAFANCRNLSMITIPASVTNIAMDAFSGSDAVVIGCYAGSVAHQYAVEHAIPFQLLDAAMYGDLDGNGTVEASDALMVLQIVVKLVSLTESQKQAADVDGNGEIEAADALTVLQKVVKLIDVFPADTAKTI